MVVLLADDNQGVRSYMASLLRRSSLIEEGSLIEEFDNGLSLIAALRSGRPDLLLTDVQMPGLTGFEVLDKIAQDPALRSLPTIIMSGAFAEGDQARFTDPKVAFLSKPVTPEAFEEAVGKLLSAR